MTFAFVAKHRHIWPVSWMCEVLGVSRSGFHAWLKRSISDRAAHDAKLVIAIDKSFKASDRTYGARRVWHDVLEEGFACGLHRIERLMRQNAMRARPRRRGKPKDEGERSVIADNILDRDFEADQPNQKWLADFTYTWTAEGWLYVAVVLDLFSRRIVGWSMKADRDAALVMDALMMAVWRRGKADALLHHSDQGSQGDLSDAPGRPPVAAGEQPAPGHRARTRHGRCGSPASRRCGGQRHRSRKRRRRTPARSRHR